MDGVMKDAGDAHLVAQTELPCFNRRRPTHAERLLEAVGRRLLVAFAVLLAPLAEKQHLLVQEEVALHRLEAGQLLDLGVAFFVLRPHAERALHQNTTQSTQLPLEGRRGKRRNEGEQ